MRAFYSRWGTEQFCPCISGRARAGALTAKRCSIPRTAVAVARAGENEEEETTKISPDRPADSPSFSQSVSHSVRERAAEAFRDEFKAAAAPCFVAVMSRGSNSEAPPYRTKESGS